MEPDETPQVSDILSRMFGQSANQMMGGPAPAPRTYTPMPEGAPTPNFFLNSPQFDLSPNKKLGESMQYWNRTPPEQQAKDAKAWSGVPQASQMIGNWGQLNPEQQAGAIQALGQKPPRATQGGGTQVSSPPKGPPDISGWSAQAKNSYGNYQQAKQAGDKQRMEAEKKAAIFWGAKWTPDHD